MGNGQASNIAPGAATLSSAERRILLEEIGRIALVLGRSMTPDSSLPVLSESVKNTKADASPLERLRLLEALWKEMPAPLSALIQRPDTTLRREPVRVPLPHAHGGPELVQRMARTPEGQAAWRETQPSQQGAPAMEPTRTLTENRLRATNLTRANRFVVSLLLAFTREAETLARLAAFCGEVPEADRIAEVSASAERWRRHPTLAALSPLASEEWPLLSEASALRTAPPYRLLFTTWRKLNAGLCFDWTGSPLLSLPPLEPWNLYEIWCFLRVGEALREAGWRCRGGDVLRWEEKDLRLTLATGQASRLVFESAERVVATAQASQRRKRDRQTLELFYQPLFLSANRQSASLLGPDANSLVEDNSETGFASLTHAMQPDIGICWQNRWFLLDSKFRTYAERGAEQEDVDKMHTYRDAIVQRGSNRRSVAAAWCLFPGEPASTPTALETAVRAYPLAIPERPFGTAGIGALRLRPGDIASLDWLSRLLSYWLQKG